MSVSSYAESVGFAPKVNMVMWGVALIGAAVVVFFAYKAFMRILHSQKLVKTRVDNLTRVLLGSGGEEEVEDEEEEEEEEGEEGEEDGHED